METRTARIPRDVYDSINNERRPGQSFAGALAERLAPVPWCIECGVQTACDADRCCVSCGRDLVLLADANAAEVLRGLAEVRTLSHRDPTESEMESALGSADEAFIGGTVRRCRNCRRPVFGGPTWCVSCVARAEVRALTAERDALRARVAELEEAARWRPVREAVPSAEPVEIILFVMGIPTRSEGRKAGPNNWKTPHGSRYDADILGWRPLGPGPVAP